MEWLSVKDRFPEPGVWVIGATHIYTQEGKKAISTSLFYDGKNEHGNHWLNDGDWENKVTHWMPLPPPPTL